MSLHCHCQGQVERGPKSQRKGLWAAAALSAALLSAGCGGQGGDSAAAPPPVVEVPGPAAPPAEGTLPGVQPAPVEEPPAVGPPPPADAPPPSVEPPPVVEPPTEAPALNVFVAQGHVGRTTVSCDGGRSWVANRSDNDAFRCFSGGAANNCDENGMRAMGLTFGNGAFIGTWGWGPKDGLRRSRDGAAWEKVLSGTSFAGIEFGNGRFVAVDGRTRFSTDGGTTWQNGGNPVAGLNRISGLTSIAEARFFAAGDPGSQGSVSFSPDGLTWRTPARIDAACGRSATGVAEAHGVIVMPHGDGADDRSLICRSSDKGATWTRQALPGSASSRPLFDGTQFLVWGAASNGKPAVFRSTDGQTWIASITRTRSPTGTLGDGPSQIEGAVALGAATFVAAVNGGFPGGYGAQRFYRSTDGIVWDELAASAYVRSHHIRFISFGQAEATSFCGTQ